MSQTWVFASHNKGKVREIDQLLSGFNVVDLNEFTTIPPEETESTFVGNALLKARNAAKLSGLPCIADDSGLVVDALDGAPGIYSARYAGEPVNYQANNRKLLEALKGVPADKRTARFVSVMVALRHADDPLPIIATGLWEGHIHDQSQGENGFGYDPVFWLEEHKKTAAELEPTEKNQRSHRAKACQILKASLKSGLYKMK